MFQRETRTLSRSRPEGTCYILSKNQSVFFQGPENIAEAKLNSHGLVYLMKGIYFILLHD